MPWERLKILEKEEKITNKPSKKGNSFFLPKGNLNKTKTIPKNSILFKPKYDFKNKDAAL